MRYELSQRGIAIQFRTVASKWNPDDVGRGQTGRVRGKPGGQRDVLGSDCVCRWLCLMKMEKYRRHLSS